MKQTKLSKQLVPSKTLLKFLRAQRDGQPFFTSNNAINHGMGCGRPSIQIRHAPLSNHTKRSIATFTCPSYALEASLFSLESLLPRRNSSSPTEHSKEAALPFYTKRTASLFHSSTSNSQKDYESKNRKNLWGLRKQWQRQNTKSTDAPALPSFFDEQAGFGRVLRPANDVKLRCTEFDEVGNVTLVNGEFKKSELIAKYGLLPRDLRKIDSSLLPNILIRPSAILINLLHLRVLIKHNKVLVFDAYGSTDSYTQSLFMYDLEGKLRAPETRTPGSSTVGGQLPYEFRAIEAILISVTSGLESEFEGIREPVVKVLRELEEDIDRDKLRHLLIYSKKLSSFEQKARLVRDAIDDLLEADDDLAAMYLTERAKGHGRGNDDHTEVEMLLENYHKVCDEIVQVSGNIVSNIRNTEEIVKAILDANRNSLMLLDLKFSIGTLGLGGGTFVAALYGMNLKNFIEESDLGFWGVSAWCSVFSVIVCVWGLRRLRKVQRVSMWGGEASDPIRGRSGWASLGNGHNEQKERIKAAKHDAKLFAEQREDDFSHVHKAVPPPRSMKGTHVIL